MAKEQIRTIYLLKIRTELERNYLPALKVIVAVEEGETTFASAKAKAFPEDFFELTPCPISNGRRCLAPLRPGWRSN